jgi:hypothetical protein
VKTESEWEARARELLPGPPFHTAEKARKAMLQLGREMAEEAGAEASLYWAKHVQAMAADMDSLRDERDAAADARAEEIAQACYHISEACAEIARSFISQPKTREQVLEEALSAIRAGTDDAGTPPYEIARRALEWKP